MVGETGAAGHGFPTQEKEVNERMNELRPQPQSLRELLAQLDIDGGLIGGAALDPAQFVDIINAANQD